MGGLNQSPEQLLASAGFTKTGAFDAAGTRVETTPAPAAVIAETPEEPAVVETTATTTEEPAPPAEQPQPTFDIASVLNGKFGDKFKSLDEIEAAYTELEAKANQDPFANDFVRNLNKALKDGIDPQLYMEVSSVDVDSMSERDALVLEMQWKNGVSKEDAEFMVDRAYKLNSEEELDQSDPDVREAQIKLKIDAKNAKNFISEYKKDSLTSPIEKRQAEVTKAWEPIIPSIVDKFKTYPLNGKTGNYEVPVAPEALKSAQELLKSVIDSGMLDNMPDKEGLAVAEAIVEKEILYQSRASFADYLADTLKAKQLEEKHNPRKPAAQEKPAQPAGDWMANFLAQQTGTRLR